MANLKKSFTKIFPKNMSPVDFSLVLTIFSSIEFLGFSASRGEKVLFCDRVRPVRNDEQCKDLRPKH